ncbi:toxin-antitoxin system YwqK family antitoxin [Tamlana flava]|uniref:toxin-antitoxin system YwqK family antitoxin n=1 Tax=Tamlana flava TaxID=3158572 RepID=UPI00351BE38D
MNRLFLIILLPLLCNAQKNWKEYHGEINFKEIVEINGLIYRNADTALVSGKVIKFNKKNIAKKYLLVSKGKPDNIGWIPFKDNIQMPEELGLGLLLSIPAHALGNNIHYPNEDPFSINRTEDYLSKQKENTSRAYHDMMERNDMNAQYNADKKKADGSFVEYYTNGLPKIKGSYKHGKLEGAWEEYYNNGQLKTKGNYKNGNTIGEWMDFNENGELLRKRRWKDGKWIEHD